MEHLTLIERWVSIGGGEGTIEHLGLIDHNPNTHIMHKLNDMASTNRVIANSKSIKN